LVAIRTFIYKALGRLHRRHDVDRRRYEFEAAYASQGDVWSYKSDPYEAKKYKRTLEAVLKWRRAKASVLEIGCSVGVFTSQLAAHFDRVAGVDVSAEALRQAGALVREQANVELVRRDVLELSFERSFSVILCAEVLYYIGERDVPAVCDKLRGMMDADSILITVHPAKTRASDDYSFFGWDEVLAGYFRLLETVEMADDTRPYRVSVFEVHAD
jgi:2-polyprenyl-3-methyl-5-hydroxy-6-metoxy-1,4-benzoquinol methylase